MIDWTAIELYQKLFPIQWIPLITKIFQFEHANCTIFRYKNYINMHLLRINLVISAQNIYTFIFSHLLHRSHKIRFIWYTIHLSIFCCYFMCIFVMFDVNFKTTVIEIFKYIPLWMLRHMGFNLVRWLELMSGKNLG